MLLSDTSKKSSGQLPHRELFPLEAHDIFTIFDSFQETDDEEASYNSHLSFICM